VVLPGDRSNGAMAGGAAGAAICSTSTHRADPGPTSHASVACPGPSVHLIAAMNRTGLLIWSTQYCGERSASPPAGSPVTVETMGMVGS
jgi:hypothetical protein